jgi:molybdate transport system substrate-binding protein
MTLDPATGSAKDTVRVFAAGAVKAVVLEMTAPFEARTGRRLDVIFDTVGALAERVTSGQQADVTILSLPLLRTIQAQGFGEGEVLDLGTTGVALGGRRGTPPPAIDTPERFSTVLLDAESIGYADPARGATAGRHFMSVLERMNLADVLRPRLRMFSFGVDAVDALGRGEVEIAVSQATEILTQPQVTYLGLLPEPYHLATAYGAVALSPHEGAREFLSALREPAVGEALKRAGFYDPSPG